MVYCRYRKRSLTFQVWRKASNITLFSLTKGTRSKRRQTSLSTSTVHQLSSCISTPPTQHTWIHTFIKWSDNNVYNDVYQRNSKMTQTTLYWKTTLYFKTTLNSNYFIMCDILDVQYGSIPLAMYNRQS